jgi:hypothetical protein
LNRFIDFNAYHQEFDSLVLKHLVAKQYHRQLKQPSSFLLMEHLFDIVYMNMKMDELDKLMMDLGIVKAEQ